MRSGPCRRFVSWLNEQKVVQTPEQMTRGHAKVPEEPAEARGGARSSRRRTVDAMMEDELEAEAKKEAADKEEKASNRRIQEEMLTALGQLNQTLEKLETQSRAPSSAAVSFVPVDSSPSGQDGA